MTNEQLFNNCPTRISRLLFIKQAAGERNAYTASAASLLPDFSKRPAYSIIVFTEFPACPPFLSFSQIIPQEYFCHQNLLFCYQYIFSISIMPLIMHIMPTTVNIDIITVTKSGLSTKLSSVLRFISFLRNTPAANKHKIPDKNMNNDIIAIIYRIRWDCSSASSMYHGTYPRDSFQPSIPNHFQPVQGQHNIRLCLRDVFQLSDKE